MTPEEKQIKQRQLEEQLWDVKKDIQKQQEVMAEELHMYQVQKTQLFEHMQRVTTPDNWNQTELIHQMQENDQILRRAEWQEQERLEYELASAQRIYHREIDRLDEEMRAQDKMTKKR